MSDELLLVPFTPEALLALIESGADAFAARFGHDAADGLRAFLVSDEVSPSWLETLRAAPAADPWTLGFAVIEPGTGLVVGTAGFKGPPDEGVAEIAYGIVPDREGGGYATRAAAWLVAFAEADERVRRVIAHTLPEANASTRVLAKCGFRLVGAVVDPEDGEVWRWERESREG